MEHKHMMMKIYRIGSYHPFYTGEADTRKELVVQAMESGADLLNANFFCYDLTDTNLTGGNFTGSCFYLANLSRSNCSGAIFWNANLSGVNFSGTNLAGADLTGAELISVNFNGSNLRDAYLDLIKADVWKVLSFADKDEAAGLLTAIKEGRVNGQVYVGKCACLVGTIAKIRRVSYNEIPGLKPDLYRPAERWFTGIKERDTPEKNQISAITAEWVEEWLGKAHQEVTA